MAQNVTAADRIHELNSINEEVTLMLRSAGLAINTLTGRDPPTQNGVDQEMKDSPQDTESASTQFEGHVTEYYTKLQAVIARLRRQAYALEEAGIITAETTTLAEKAASAAKPDARTARDSLPASNASKPARITNGGLGNLDIGWLNSRGNKVALEKEHEIMIEAKELLQEMLASEQVSDTG